MLKSEDNPACGSAILMALKFNDEWHFIADMR